MPPPPASPGRGFVIGVAVATAATLLCSALIFTHMRDAAEPGRRPEALGETLPATALEELAKELTHPETASVSLVAPQAPDQSAEIRFDRPEGACTVRVVEDPNDRQTWLLVRAGPDGQRTLCPGVRRGGFRAIEVEEAWVLKLEAIRWERDGSYVPVRASRTVPKPAPR